MMMVSCFMMNSIGDEVEKFMYKTVAGINRKVDELTDDDMRRVWFG